MTAPADPQARDVPWTRGPWRLDEDPHATRAGLLDDTYHLIDAGKGFHPEGFCTGGYMSLADARLIAAAPQMAEALEAARYQLITLGGDGRGEAGMDRIQGAVLDLIDAALAAAGGAA